MFEVSFLFGALSIVIVCLLAIATNNGGCLRPVVGRHAMVAYLCFYLIFLSLFLFIFIFIFFVILFFGAGMCVFPFLFFE